MTFARLKENFEKVLKMDPGYKYAQDYFDSARSKLIMMEMKGRRDRRGRRNREFVGQQEPIEFIAEQRLLDESKAVSDQMTEEFKKGPKFSGVSIKRNCLKRVSVRLNSRIIAVPWILWIKC